MSKPPNQKRKVVLRVDEIETEDGGALNLGNASRIDFLNTYSVSGGVYSQVESQTRTGVILETEQELLNTNNCLGAITRVANTSRVGGTVRIVAHGNFTSFTGRDLEIKWKLGNDVLGTTGVMGIDKNYDSEGWYLDLILVVRAIGDVGVASISTSGSLSWLKKQMGGSEQYSLNNINDTTYETETNKDFGLTATWSNGATILDTITLTNCIITRLF